MRKLFLAITMMCSCLCAQAMAQGSCGALSGTEQSFASGMSAANREMFCSKFSQGMRDTAMKMSGTPDNMGNVMTPDQSVEKVARDNNIIPNGKGGCAVK